MGKTIVERVWQHRGLTCAVLFVHSEHRCGYVKIPPLHPWHGKSYNDTVPGARPAADVLSEARSFDNTSIIGVVAAALGGPAAVDEWTQRMAGQVAVHGGLTFSRQTDLCGAGDGWWIGFDCMHDGDMRNPEGEAARYLRDHGFSDGGHFWTEEETAAETERLAAQVAKAATT